MLTSLRQHWPEYLMEAWGLGMLMVSAGVFATLLEFSGSPLRQAISDPNIRLALMGLAMGLTVIGIIYSPWGQQSGAHINPAVTLTFLRLRTVAPSDALFYIIAQLVGGTLGVLLVAILLGGMFTEPPVSYIVTVPGPTGISIAFLAEFLLSLGLMLAILFFMNTKRLARLTGLAAGILVAIYVTVEAPLSGMSINPARTFASGATSGVWNHAWIYYTAPILGMLAAVEIYRLLRRRPTFRCAKLDHPDHKRCIHCGYEPRSDHTPAADPLKTHSDTTTTVPSQQPELSRNKGEHLHERTAV